MMREKVFDVIIVGAGPAGTTAALVLAKSGFKVALIERGEQPGSKNVFGGVFHYNPIFHELVPHFSTQAPVERYVTNYTTTFLAEKASLTFSYNDQSFSRPPFNGYTLLRSKFDCWYSSIAEKAGAFLISSTTVEDLIWKENQIIGVKTDRPEGNIYADVVIAADGVNALIPKKAGLRSGFLKRDISVAAKEIRSLPRKTIEERFSLQEREGSAHLFIGSVTKGVEGGAFLYTNMSSISIGVVAKLAALERQEISIGNLLENFKELPQIKRALTGSHLKEYSGHLIPEGGKRMMPRLFGNGILVVGDAASLVLSTGLALQGMNLAVESGFLAAKAFKWAKRQNDFTQRALSHYHELMEKSFVLLDLETFRGMPNLLSNQRLYSIYPSIACGIFNSLYKSDGRSKRRIGRLLIDQIRGKLPLKYLLKDTVSILRALI